MDVKVSRFEQPKNRNFDDNISESNEIRIDEGATLTQMMLTHNLSKNLARADLLMAVGGDGPGAICDPPPSL